MTVPEVRQYLGRNCWVSWVDRLGNEHKKMLMLQDLQILPMYGPYIVSNSDEVHVAKITSIMPLD